MPESFQSINQPAGAGMPQFSQTNPVVGGGIAEAAVNLAGLGANIFSQVSAAKVKREKAESAATADATIGKFQQGLLDIRQAASTNGGINATAESRRLLSEFSAAHPELRLEASKAYKQETGANPSGLDDMEEAQLKLQLEAFSNNYGRQGASEEHNAEQLDLYMNMKQQDKAIASRIQQIQLQVQEGGLHESELKKSVLSGTKELAGTYTTKVASSMDELIQSYQSGAITLEEAQLKIRRTRNDINREASSFGKFAEDPKVKAYLVPLNDSVQLAEDIISGKMEKDAISDKIALNKARRTSVFLSDPETIDLVVASEAFNHTAGVTAQASAKVLKFLSDGRKSPKGTVTPADPTGMDEKERKATMAVVDSMLNDPKKSTPASKEEAAATVAGMAEYLARNGMDFDKDDRKFALEILSVKGAMETLNPRQRATVMSAFTTYLSDDVDTAVRENISNAELPFGTTMDRAHILGGTRSSKPVKDVADLTVSDGNIFWSIKPEFRGQQSAQNMIRKLNRNIEETVVPAIQVYSKGLVIPFDKGASIFIPSLGLEEGGNDGKKQVGSRGTDGGTPDGKAGAVGVDSSSPTNFVNSIREVVNEHVAGTGIYPEVAIAQAALESGWGKKVKGGNFYGIKGKGQTITTHEVIDGKRVKIDDEFKTFTGISDSVGGYVEFLQSNPRYKAALDAKSPEEQAKALQRAGYATDPEYANKLISIIKTINEGK